MKELSSFLQARIPVMAAAVREPNTSYLATEGMVYRSGGGGATWNQLPVEWEEDKQIERHSLSMAVSQSDAISVRSCRSAGL